jgi:hypothetical protein
MTIATAHEALSVALETVQGLRVERDPGAVLDPPAAIVGPPMLTFGGPSSDPVGARWVVIVVVNFDDRAFPALWELIPQVTAAIESLTDAVVVDASPGTWQNGAISLPCYEISAEMSLN